MEPYIMTLSEILVPVTSCLFFFKWGLFYRQTRYCQKRVQNKKLLRIKYCNLEDPDIDPGTSRMLSGRSTIWANPPASAYNAVGQDLTSRQPQSNTE